MRQIICFGALAAVCVCCADYPVSVPEPEQVRLVRGFWHDRLETNRLATVKIDFDRYIEAGFLTNFQHAAARKTGVPYYGAPFEDADLFRIMEGAFTAARAAGRRNGQVARAESFIPLIEKAMEEDGYLYTARTTGQCHRRDVGSNRFERIQFSHEIYNVGQLVCAAVAHKKLTGRDDLVRLAVKASEVFLRTFGRETGSVTTGNSSCISAISGVRTLDRRRGNLNAGSITVRRPSVAPSSTANIPRSARITNEGSRFSLRTPPLNSMSAETCPRVLRFTCA